MCIRDRLETLPFWPIALLYFSLFWASLGLNNEVVASYNWPEEPKAKSTEIKLLAYAWCMLPLPEEEIGKNPLNDCPSTQISLLWGGSDNSKVKLFSTSWSSRHQEVSPPVNSPLRVERLMVTWLVAGLRDDEMTIK